MGAQPQAPSAPSIPPFDFAKAQEIVNEAYKQQEIVTKKLKEKAEPYEAAREVSQAELGKILTGRTGPEATGLYEQRFGEQVPAISKQYATEQKGFKPGLLDLQTPDSSFNLLADVLRGSSREYTGAMNRASSQASSRLYQTLAAPIMGFEQIANKPSINKLYDPTYMQYATRPPTVSSDIESMKPIYTYNV